ncbi:Calycin-like protein [Artemisia annua]|uniref:Calycin-like protein n=1 Tax=Artemisia annua TaxID=35608 RepID=A0A2U1MA93_ARTAN|nr:Calycin-like protein [Artemisia annua]
MEGGARVVHPAVEPLSYLIGTWKGTGEGGFPTISSFSYGEELTFTHPGNKKPVIAYSQKTWKLNSGEPMHAESGYWRPKPDGTIEVVIAQSTGLVEIQKGTYDAEKKEINLQSELVGNASKVKEISRIFTLVNEELTYVVEMATNLTSRQPHLKASLKKL